MEARIEFLDRDGFSTRGVGRLEMTLEDRESRFVETWILSLGNAQTNQSHFDAITRTYLVRLSVPNRGIPDDSELIAALVLPDGRRLTDSRMVTGLPEAARQDGSQADSLR